MSVLKFKLHNTYLSDFPEHIEPLYDPVPDLVLDDSIAQPQAGHPMSPTLVNRINTLFKTDITASEHDLTGTHGYFYAPRYTADRTISDKTVDNKTPETEEPDDLTVIVLFRYNWTYIH